MKSFPFGLLVMVRGMCVLFGSRHVQHEPFPSNPFATEAEGWSIECSRSVVENGKWQRQRRLRVRGCSSNIVCLCGRILDFVPPVMRAVRKWWIKLPLCASTVEHVLLMLAATPPICWLIHWDITLVRQLTGQGGEIRVGTNNFYSHSI